jgi:hypothetical protein
MTNQTPDLHTTFDDNLALYLAGGLPAEETAQFESHAATCPDCAAKLADARKSDEAMRSLFAPLAPGQDFEDRLIAGLRKPPVIRRLHPMVRLAASGVAAAIVLGAVGHFGGRALDKPRYVKAGASSLAPAIKGAKQLGAVMQLSENEPNSDYGLPASGDTGTSYLSGRDRPLGENSGFDFFYQTAGGDSPETKTPAQILAKRVEPNGALNLEWKPDQDKVDGTGGVPEVKMSVVETTPIVNGIVHPAAQNRVGSDGRGSTPTQFGPAKADLTKGLLGGMAQAGSPNIQVVQLGRAEQESLHLDRNKSSDEGVKEPGLVHGVSHSATSDEDKKDIEKFANALKEKSHFELETTKLDRKSGGDQTKEPALASAQPMAEVPQLVRTASTPPVAVALVPSTDMPASVGSAPTTPVAVALGNPTAVTETPGSAPATPYTANIIGDTANTPPTTQGSIATSAAAAQKIIRTGAMEFEVDSFDSAFLQITKIATEESGFVAATDSQKLENGKVKGTVTLRCPPEHLDTLVLKLRGLGDLKTQRITAQDVTKQFTDYESQLRAARAMEERLLDIIKTGKGAVKDLVEAEKQLGIYREKIEQIEGELRYMGSQVALSTLSVSLMERDIRTPFAAVEAEQISAGIEAEDVERARAEALKLIDDAKGRVIESELKKLDAGQLAATLVAEVSPDATGALGDHLKQLGRVARWEATRKQTTEGGSGSPMQLPPNTKLERQPTRFSVSIYNLANVAPRQITGLTLVANDVEAAYRSILAAMNGDPKTPPIGRIVTSNLSAQKSDQVTGSITLEVKSDQSPAIEAALRTAGSVMHLTVTENPDQNGVTDAKRGYGIIIIAAANVPAREQQTITVASKDVGATYNKLLAMLRDPKASARVINSQLTEPEEDNITGSVDFEIPITNRPAVDALLSDGKQSDVISRNVIRSADTENTLADKLHLTVSIGSAERLPPHETTRLTLEAADVAKALDTAAAAGQSDAHVTERSLSQQPDGRSTAHIAIDVPLSAAQTTLDQLRSLGKVASAESARDAKVTAGPLARARFEVELENAQTLVPPQDGMSASIQRGLRTALNGLLWSVQMVVVGLVLVGPFALVIWAAWRLVRRGCRKAATNPGAA